MMKIVEKNCYKATLNFYTPDYKINIYYICMFWKICVVCTGKKKELKKKHPTEKKPQSRQHVLPV